MKAKLIICGLGLSFLFLDIISLLFFDAETMAHRPQRVRAWGMSALRHDEFGRIFLVLIDIFLSWILVKLLFKK